VWGKSRWGQTVWGGLLVEAWLALDDDSISSAELSELLEAWLVPDEDAQSISELQELIEAWVAPDTDLATIGEASLPNVLLVRPDTTQVGEETTLEGEHTGEDSLSIADLSALETLLQRLETLGLTEDPIYTERLFFRSDAVSVGDASLLEAGLSGQDGFVLVGVCSPPDVSMVRGDVVSLDDASFVEALRQLEDALAVADTHRLDAEHEKEDAASLGEESAPLQALILPLDTLGITDEELFIPALFAPRFDTMSVWDRITGRLISTGDLAKMVEDRDLAVSQSKTDSIPLTERFRIILSKHGEPWGKVGYTVSPVETQDPDEKPAMEGP